MNKDKSVAIIGSGIGGIAAAIRLAKKGFVVSVFESNGYTGGKLSEISGNGYRFDAGPSLFTLPKLVDELFELCGENPHEYFDYLKLDENCTYFYEDGTKITAFGERSKLVKELSSKTSTPTSAIDKAIDRSAFLYENLSELFMFSSLNDPRIFFSKNAFQAYRNLFKLGFFRTMHQSNEQLFEDNRLVRFFDRYATYNGSDPYQTPATMNIIPHLEMSIGAYFPIGGMYQITLALTDLAKRMGVTFHLNSPVEKILIDKKKAIGIQVHGERKLFDGVVSNMDVVNTYRHLLPEIKPPRFLLNQPKSSSALIFYWGIKKSFPQLGLHNIFFSENYKSEFECIFKQQKIFQDPTVYVNISSKYNVQDAPTGCENWFTMINVPNNQGQNWEDLIAQARKNILDKLSRNLKTDISNLIAFEDVLDPRSIESKTSSALGALYGNSSNNLFAAFLRHANKSKRLKNLYFCGGSVHPGGGIPMSLASAKIMVKHFD